MKGKNVFTESEINAIKALVEEKVLAGRNEQKKIRDSIRKIGFYFSDFSSKKGYSVEDLESLILSNQIKVIGEQGQMFVKRLDKKVQSNISKPKSFLSSSISINLDSLLKDFVKNYFNPIMDSKECIPDNSGVYIIVLKKNSKLPKISCEYSCEFFDRKEVIYVGISSKSLRKRDFKQHFNGNAGGSTLRKSIGSMFGFKKVPRSENKDDGKTKFSKVDEDFISDWMKNNLEFYYLIHSKQDIVEDLLIERFNPPLNLAKNTNRVNSEFRRSLSQQRSGSIR